MADPVGNMASAMEQVEKAGITPAISAAGASGMFAAIDKEQKGGDVTREAAHAIASLGIKAEAVEGPSAALPTTGGAKSHEIQRG